MLGGESYMSDDVKPLNIDAVFRKTKNRVSRVGVELEGAWKSLPDIPLQRDGSVFNGRAPVGLVIGELPIGPVQPAALPKLLNKYYPDTVNSTCGMHIHMSFETLWYYSLLMVPEYQETVSEYLMHWAKVEGFKPSHHIWERLAGRVEFCKKEFFPDSQVSNKRKDHDHFRPGNRYTIIHYCWRLRTIECRVLPMMTNSAQACRAIYEVIDITNACLYVLGKKREPKIVDKLVLPNGDLYEEHIEEML